MSKHKRIRNLAIVVLVVLGTGTALAGMARATGLINAINPEAASVSMPAIVPPLLAPPSDEGYVPQPGTAKVSAPDDRSVAQLGNVPADLAQAVSADFPDLTTKDALADSDTYYEILSSIRYEGNGHTVLVTTARPSPAAAQQAAVYGDRSIELKDGTVAWLTVGLPGDLPNRIVFPKGDLIITIVSDLPHTDLENLAADIVVH